MQYLRHAYTLKKKSVYLKFSFYRESCIWSGNSHSNILEVYQLKLDTELFLSLAIRHNH